MKSLKLNTRVNDNIIDLGLPSGTLWAEHNEECYCDFDEAVEKYGDRLPTREQWEELMTQCKWEWIGDGYKVTGTNGNYIILPAAGDRGCDGSVYGVGSYGIYWSSTPFDSDFARRLYFIPVDMSVGNDSRCDCFSVRLVK